MTAYTARTDVRLTQWLWCGLFAYVATNALLQWTLSGSADADQAEQLVLSQTLQLGYSTQPPLYTWLVMAVFALTGPQLGVLVVMKIATLGLVLAGVLGAARTFGLTVRQQAVAAAGLAFVPQLVWEAQRDLTHSVLVTALAACTLWQVARMRQRAGAGQHALLGLLVGLGLLSKYNYVLFLAGLAVAAACVPPYRAALFNRRLLLAAGVAALVLLPHAAWVLANFHTASSGSLEKLQARPGHVGSGLGSAAFAALAFATPLWLFALVLRGGRTASPAPAENRRLLALLLGATLLAVLLFVAGTGAQKIKDRWYQPLAFYLPLLIAAWAQPAPRRARVYVGVALAFAGIVTLGLAGRIVLAERADALNRKNLPYPALMAALRDATPGEAPAVVFSESSLLAGNARLGFPQAVHVRPNDPPRLAPGAGTAWVLCESDPCSTGFRRWLEQHHGIDTAALRFEKFEVLQRFARSTTHAVYRATVPRP